MEISNKKSVKFTLLKNVCKEFGDEYQKRNNDLKSATLCDITNENNNLKSPKQSAVLYFNLLLEVLPSF